MDRIIRPVRRWIAPVLCGLAAGAVCGFLGSGGGIVLVFALARLCPTLDLRDRFAVSVAVILPLSAVSAVLYRADGRMPEEALLAAAVPALLGGWAGGRMLERIRPAVLQKIFAVVLLIGGAILLFPRRGG